MYYVLVAVTDQHDKLLSPEAPMSKLCNPPTCHHCVETWLLDNAHEASGFLSRNGHMGQGLVQGCATAGRRVQSYLVYVGHLFWGVHFTCADCGALLSQQPVKCDVPYGGPGTVGRFNDRYQATQVHSRTSAAEVARHVGYCGLGYCEPSYRGHYKALRNHLVKAVPWERD